MKYDIIGTVLVVLSLVIFALAILYVYPVWSVLHKWSLFFDLVVIPGVMVAGWLFVIKGRYLRK